MSPISNDQLQLVPQTSFDGPALAFEFPGLRVGVAEYAEGPTGCTVIHLPKGGPLTTDIRGGAVGVVGDRYGWAHAVCLAGGSLYGLEAAAGVTAELAAQHDYSTVFTAFPLVAGAIIYDYGPRSNSIYPDKALGRAALKTSREGWFPLGARGAGRSATVGKLGRDRYRGETAGQGAAFGQFGPVKVAVFTVVNALGAIIDRSGNVVRGCVNRETGQRTHPDQLVSLAFPDGDAEQSRDSGSSPDLNATENTTISALVTNLRLSHRELQQLGRQVHSSMARGIHPFHTLYDGDVLFTLSTNEIEQPNVDLGMLGVGAAALAWDAILSCY